MMRAPSNARDPLVDCIPLVDCMVGPTFKTMLKGYLLKYSIFLYS